MFLAIDKDSNQDAILLDLLVNYRESLMAKNEQHIEAISELSQVNTLVDRLHVLVNS